MTKTETGFTGDTATRMIRTYEKFSTATSAEKIPFATLIELAQAKTPKALIKEVLAEAEAA